MACARSPHGNSSLAQVENGGIALPVKSLFPLTVLLTALAAPFCLGAVNFNRDVRPLLSDQCFQCHGPDEKERKGGLRLDLAAEAQKPAKSGAVAIVPGKPEESEIIRRLHPADPDDLMPPAKTGKSLTEDQKNLLTQWIKEGAPYQGHWAFSPPERPTVPAVPDSAPASWRISPIDAFLYQKLSLAGLQPNPEADRTTLLRRAALDLTGLPPSQEETAAFLQDNAPNAYEKAVDKLLASPRYGERMAAQWLDFARYADSNGFQSDASRQMWIWREWVINAFNRNLPFDQFTIEQLAGDLLPNPTREQIVATGFNRNHRLNGEGGRIVEEWFAETVIDRVETTGLTWMALTLNCSRCHDHKYDPISQKEFYSLFAYFNSIDESGVMDEFGGAAGTRKGGNSRPVIDVPTSAQELELARLDTAIKSAEAKANEAKAQAASAQTAWEEKLRASLSSQEPPWQGLTGAAAVSEGGATLTPQPDGSWLAGGKNPDHDVYVITAPVPAGKLTGLLLETLPDNSLPNKSVGRFPNGNFVLSDFDAEISAPGLTAPVTAAFARVEADYEQKGWPINSILNEKPQRKRGAKNRQGWAVDGPTRREPNKAAFLLATPLEVPAGAKLIVTLRHDALGGHNVGRFRLSTSSKPASTLGVSGKSLLPDVIAALRTPTSQRTKEQVASLAKLYVESPEHPAKAAEAEMAALRKARDAVDSEIASTMVMKEAAKPREARVLQRGQYDHPQEVVSRGVPAALPQLPQGAPNNRLGFAQWLVSGFHPLTARVWANRAWERFFGTGLVKTSENLGSQSEWPSHPELLDWLATEFVRLKWDMKAMQREIVLSAAYRQSSRFTPQSLTADPENRLLARGPRFRLSAEMLRDQALLLSGLLAEKIGGPSVRPYMPEGVWDETSVYGDMRGYKPDLGEGLYRRTLYTIWKRTAAPPTMLLFDSPSREICTVKRSRTNTPLQALALLNEVTYVEAARMFGQQMLEKGGTAPADRISWAFRRATLRAPSTEELKILTAGYAKRLERFRQRPEEAKRLLTVGTTPSSAHDSAELAACTTTANVILNLDEVVTRE